MKKKYCHRQTLRDSVTSEMARRKLERIIVLSFVFSFICVSSSSNFSLSDLFR